jgi:hypothetical protein
MSYLQAHPINDGEPEANHTSGLSPHSIAWTSDFGQALPTPRDFGQALPAPHDFGQALPAPRDFGQALPAPRDFGQALPLPTPPALPHGVAVGQPAVLPGPVSPFFTMFPGAGFAIASPLATQPHSAPHSTPPVIPLPAAMPTPHPAPRLERQILPTGQLQTPSSKTHAMHNAASRPVSPLGTPHTVTSNGPSYGAMNGDAHNGDTRARLADLVVRAEASIDELERLARTALDATAASGQAAADLQERLRLGVRMLQAFDVQIQRCEVAATQAGPQMGLQIASQFTNQMNAVAQQSEMRVRAAVEALEQRMHEALPFLDERLRAAHEQAVRLVDERIVAAEQRLDERQNPLQDELRRFADDLAESLGRRLDAMIEERAATLASTPVVPTAPAIDLDAALAPLGAFEQRMTTMMNDLERRAAHLDGQIRSTIDANDARLRSLIRESTEAADGLLGTVGTAGTLRDLIADEARASRRLADEAHATCRDHQREMQDMLERCAIARSSLEQQLHDLRTAAAETEARLAAAKSLRTDIEHTLRQITPLESSLRQDNAAMHSVVETISTNVRQSLAEEMRNFSHALRGLAARAETSFAHGRFDEFSAVPEASTPTPAPAPAAAHDDSCGHELNGHAVTDVHASTMPTSPIDTRRLTAEILALDATSLLRPPARA